MLYILVSVSTGYGQQVQGNSLALFSKIHPADKLSIFPPASFSNWSLTLPTTAGTANYVLQTDGAGVTTWVALPSLSSAVIINPATTLRNVIKPTADAIDLRLQNFNSSSTAFLQTWEYDNGSSITISGSMDNQGNLTSIGTLKGTTLEAGSSLLLDDGSGNSASLSAGTAMTGNVSWHWPSVDGSTGQFLKTNGSGVLSFASPTGTVSSFSSGNLSPLFTASVATATTTPALSFTLNSQTANTVFAGPTSGGAATPTFRALVAADIPSGSGSYINNGTSAQTNAAFNITGASGTGTTGTITSPSAGSGSFIALHLDNTRSSVGDANYGLTLNVSGGTPNWDITGTSTSWKVDNTGNGTFPQITLGAVSSVTGALVLDHASSSHTTTLKAGNATANVTYILPTADGSSAQVLSTNGSGVLSWATASGGSGSLWFKDPGSGSPTIAPTSTATDALGVGSGAKATGVRAVAFSASTAHGVTAFSGGESNLANGDKSLAFGGQSDTANGANSVVIGGNNNTTGQTSSGIYSGINCKTGIAFANGPAYVWGGNANIASGVNASTIGGQGLNAKGFGQTVIGQFNVVQATSFGNNFTTTDQAFIIGNGTAAGSLSTVFYVTNNGNVVINSATGAGAISDGNGIDLFGKIVRVRTSKTPANTAAAGNTGEWCWDDNFFYVYTSAGWKRTALSTF